MTDYIIDPTVFYWMNALGNIQVVSAIIGSILLAAAIGFMVAYVYNYTEFVDYERYERTDYADIAKKYMKICKKFTIGTFIPGLIFVLLAVFIPSKQTCVEMLVAKTATFDNVNWTVSQVKEIVDYIVKALQSV